MKECSDSYEQVQWERTRRRDLIDVSLYSRGKLDFVVRSLATQKQLSLSDLNCHHPHTYLEREPSLQRVRLSVENGLLPVRVARAPACSLASCR